MVKTPSCPDVSQLSRFATGSLPSPELDELEEHLNSCPRCLDRLPALSARDTLVEALEKAATMSAGPDDPLLSNVIERLGNLTEAPTTAISNSPGESFPDLAGGTLVGQYEVLAKLGQGGMGAVYKALHTRLGKVVALKLLHADRMANASAVARFRREMKAVGMIDHPNLVRASDAGEADGMHYLVMEYVDGIDLSELSKRLGPLPIAAACALVRQAGVGLQAAHQRGMIHRDVKPGNLMLARQEFGTPVVKVLDLGLAMLDDAADANSTSGHIMGTVDYMAPEQAEESHAVDPRVDVYSLGASLFTLLTGRPPYHAYPTRMQKMRALAVEPIPALRSLRAEAPVALAVVLERMLAKERDQRYATMTQAVEALTPFAAGADLAELLGAGTRREEALTTAPERETCDESPRTDGGRSSAVTEAAPRRSCASLLAVAALLALLPLGWWLAGVVFRVETANGTLVIEIKDKDVEARLKNGKVVLTGPDGKVLYTLMPSERNKQVAVGHYLISVEGADGLVVETPKFEIRKGVDTRVLVTMDPKLAESLASSAEQVAAAEWVLSKKGFVTVRVDGEDLLVNKTKLGTTIDQLPRGSFRIVGVNLSPTNAETLPVNDHDLRQLACLRRLEALDLGHQPITTAGLTHFAGCSGLKDLRIYATQIGLDAIPLVRRFEHLQAFSFPAFGESDQWAEALAKMPTVRSVHAYRCDITDAGVAHLARLPKLEKLTLADVQLTDASFKSLATCRSLRRLQLDGCGKVTEDAVRKLKKALPDCEITYQGKAVTASDSVPRERRVAEWVLGKNSAIKDQNPIAFGYVTILVRGSTLKVDKLDQLPKDPFTVVGARVVGDILNDDLRELAPLARLEVLNLGGLPITGEGLAHLTGCTELKDLSLLQCGQVGAEAFPVLARFPKLETIMIPGNASDVWAAWLAKMPNIREVKMYRGDITDIGVAHLARMPRLEKLLIDECGHTTDASLKALAACKSLRRLQLVNMVEATSKMTWAEVDRLRKALPNCAISPMK